MGEAEMERLGKLIVGLLRAGEDEVAVKGLSEAVAELAAEFPGYPAGFSGHA
jgi:glycine/serine hydroxymethyltransferase